MSTESDYSSLYYFGKVLIDKFKNEQLEWFDRMCHGHQKGDLKKGLADKVHELDNKTQNIIAACITGFIEKGLHDFLFAIRVDNDFDKRLKILVDDKNVADLSEELHWELFGEDGWDARFSKYPSADAVYDAYNKGEVPKIISE